LSLQLLCGALQTAGPATLAHPALHSLVRRHVYAALLATAVSPLPLVFRWALVLFEHLFRLFRADMRLELGVFYESILLRLLDSPVDTPASRRLKLEIVSSLGRLFSSSPVPPAFPSVTGGPGVLSAPSPALSTPNAVISSSGALSPSVSSVSGFAAPASLPPEPPGQLVVDLFVNYDCATGSSNVFERTINALCVCVKSDLSRRAHVGPERVLLGPDGLPIGGVPAVVDVLPLGEDWLPSGRLKAPESVARQEYSLLYTGLSACAINTLRIILRAMGDWLAVGDRAARMASTAMPPTLPMSPNARMEMATAAAASVGVVLSPTSPTAEATDFSAPTRGTSSGDLSSDVGLSSPTGTIATPSAAASVVAELRDRRSYKARVAAAARSFNLLSPKKGVRALVAAGAFSDPSGSVAAARECAEWLLANTRVGTGSSEGKVSTTAVGELLGEPDEPFLTLLEQYVRASAEMLGWGQASTSIVEAMRGFLGTFRIPGEGQKIDRILQMFARVYTEPAERTFRTPKTCYGLTFALMMLQTELHNPVIADSRRMTRETFIRNTKGIDYEHELTDDFLSGLYDELKAHPFSLIEDEDRRADADGSREAKLRQAEQKRAELADAAKHVLDIARAHRRAERPLVAGEGVDASSAPAAEEGVLPPGTLSSQPWVTLSPSSSHGLVGFMLEAVQFGVLASVAVALTAREDAVIDIGGSVFVAPPADAPGAGDVFIDHTALFVDTGLRCLERCVLIAAHPAVQNDTCRTAVISSLAKLARLVGADGRATAASGLVLTGSIGPVQVRALVTLLTLARNPMVGNSLDAATWTTVCACCSQLDFLLSLRRLGPATAASLVSARPDPGTIVVQGVFSPSDVVDPSLAGFSSGPVDPSLLPEAGSLQQLRKSASASASASDAATLPPDGAIGSATANDAPDVDAADGDICTDYDLTDPAADATNPDTHGSPRSHRSESVHTTSGGAVQTLGTAGVSAPSISVSTLASSGLARFGPSARDLLNAEMLARLPGLPAMCLKVIESTRLLSHGAVAALVSGLISTSEFEIASSLFTVRPTVSVVVPGESANKGLLIVAPGARLRTYALQQLIEVAELSMPRPAFEFFPIWTKIGAHLTRVATTRCLDLALLAVDALRQLAVKYLARVDIPNASVDFQRAFLSPFASIAAYVPRETAHDVQELVLRCVQQFVQAEGRVSNIRSGWIALFAVLRAVVDYYSEVADDDLVSVSADIDEDAYENVVVRQTALVASQVTASHILLVAQADATGDALLALGGVLTALRLQRVNSGVAADAVRTLHRACVGCTELKGPSGSFPAAAAVAAPAAPAAIACAMSIASAVTDQRPIVRAAAVRSFYPVFSMLVAAGLMTLENVIERAVLPPLSDLAAFNFCPERPDDVEAIAWAVTDAEPFVSAAAKLVLSCAPRCSPDAPSPSPAAAAATTAATTAAEVETTGDGSAPSSPTSGTNLRLPPIPALSAEAIRAVAADFLETVGAHLSHLALLSCGYRDSLDQSSQAILQGVVPAAVAALRAAVCTLAPIMVAPVGSMALHGGETLSSSWRTVLAVFNRLFAAATPTSLLAAEAAVGCPVGSLAEVNVPSFSLVRAQCVLTLVLLQASQEMVAALVVPVPQIYTTSSSADADADIDTDTTVSSSSLRPLLPPQALTALLSMLARAHMFARRFNEYLPLRCALWELGFMDRLPSLLKQEANGLAALADAELAAIQAANIPEPSEQALALAAAAREVFTPVALVSIASFAYRSSLVPCADGITPKHIGLLAWFENLPKQIRDQLLCTPGSPPLAQDPEQAAREMAAVAPAVAIALDAFASTPLFLEQNGVRVSIVPPLFELCALLVPSPSEAIRAAVSSLLAGPFMQILSAQ
jgi:hypothetical protein